MSTLKMPLQSSQSLDECTVVTIECDDSTELNISKSRAEDSLKPERSDDGEEEEPEDLWYVYCDDEDLAELASLSSVSLISEEGVHDIDISDEFDPFPYNKEQPVCEEIICYRNDDRSTTSMISISIDSIQLPSHDGTQVSQNEMFVTKKRVTIDPF
mmetsp:Transcript_30842/g.45611  ORF Transcript_30842/g.45611 Transcript_30842/m.45611 type:complete len:157 (-) Transcript_30842:60-530(-)